MKAKILGFEKYSDKKYILVKIGKEYRKIQLAGFNGLFEVEIAVPNGKVRERLTVIGGR